MKRHPPRRGIVAVLAASLLAGCGTAVGPSLPAESYRVLMITQPRDSDGMHPSSNVAAEVFPDLGRRHGFGVDVATDPAVLNAANLRKYKAVVFVNRNGASITDRGQRAAFEDYIRAGGGFVGVHATTTGSATAWPFFTGLHGGAAYFGHTQANSWGEAFENMPPSLRGVQRIWRGPREAAPAGAEPGTRPGYLQVNWVGAYFVVQEPASPAMAGLLPSHFREEEWYGVEPNPRPRVRVLATVDEATYNPAGGTMGADHPIAWCHRYEGGRAVYSSLGHKMSTWRSDTAFHAHVAGMVAMAAGAAPFDCTPK